MIYRILTASSLTLGLLAILSACSSESELRFTDSFIQDHDFTVELNSAGDGLDISFTPQSDASYQLTRTSESGCSADTCADYLALTINDDGTATDSLPTDTYYYKLTVSLSGISEKFSAQHPPAGVLPEDFTATAGNGQVTLSWTPYSDDTTYNIYRSSDPDCDLDNYDTACSNAEGERFIEQNSGFIDTKLTVFTVYYYWIEAILNDVTYRATNSISATPITNIIPSDFTAVAGVAEVTLDWTPYSDSTTYNIYRSSDPNCDLDNYNTACSASEGELFTNREPGFVDSALTAYTTYYYWIEAIHNGVTQRITNPTLATPTEKTISLNDTGIDWGSDYTFGNNSDCSSNVPAPQDCDQGRDATDNDESDGHAGFSFTKLDSYGNALAANATNWSCVLDNISGLVWEVKVDDDSERDKDNIYRWGGLTAVGRDSSNREGDYYDDWNDLVNFTNSEQLCGFSDWRVPSRQELRSIVDYSHTNPSIDSDYFPNTRSSSYWSASPKVSDIDDAWQFDFHYGDVDNSDRKDVNLVRLVHYSH